jgi:hypothetical protein
MDASSEIGERVRVIVQECGYCFFESVPDHVHKYEDFLAVERKFGNDIDGGSEG